MSLKIIALLLVTVGFAILLWRMYAPGSKAYFDAMGHIPLDEDSQAPNSSATQVSEKE